MLRNEYSSFLPRLVRKQRRDKPARGRIHKGAAFKMESTLSVELKEKASYPICPVLLSAKFIEILSGLSMR